MEDKALTCQWKNCGKISTIVYYDNGLCEKHWIKSCGMEIESVRKILKIKIKNDEKNT